MDSKNELVGLKNLKKDQFTPKIGPIEVDFIKNEKIDEEECFSFTGIVESFEVDKNSVKKELFDNDEIKNFSLPNVRKKFNLLIKTSQLHEFNNQV